MADDHPPTRPPLPAPADGTTPATATAPTPTTHLTLATSWYTAVREVEQHVVRLSTPGGWGSGFLIAYSKDSSLVGVATAAHVIQHAHAWENPIRIDHVVSGRTLLLRPNDRAISIDAERDTAVIVLRNGDLPLPQAAMPLTPQGKFLAVGNDIGWLGFPAIQSAGLCFFSGRVSAWVQSLEAYLVDGNAINGVSGGPTFAHIAGQLYTIGVVSAYVPNRATGETLPGLAIVRSIERLHAEVARLTSWSQAKQEETPPSQDPAPPPPPANPTRG